MSSRIRRVPAPRRGTPAGQDQRPTATATPAGRIGCTTTTTAMTPPCARPPRQAAAAGRWPCPPWCPAPRSLHARTRARAVAGRRIPNRRRGSSVRRARTHARTHDCTSTTTPLLLACPSSCRAAEQRASRATARGNVRCLSRAGGIINARLQPRPRRSGILCCHRHGNLLSLRSPSGGTACFGGGVSLDDRRRTLDLIAAVRKMVLVHTLHDRYDHRVRKKGDYQDDRPQLTNVVTLLISRGAGQAM